MRRLTATRAPSLVASVPNVRARGRHRVESFRIDRFAGLFVDAVGAIFDALQSSLDLGEVELELLEDRHVLLALECLGCLVGGMLVVMRQLAALRGFLFVEAFAAQTGDEVFDTVAFLLEALPRVLLVEVLRHGGRVPTEHAFVTGSLESPWPCDRLRYSN